MLQNCRECDRIFSHPTNKLCPQCIRDQNNQFNLVKDYLRKNPNSLLREVVQETEVSIERIKEFIKEGRLKIVPPDYYHECQLCGTKITSGKICNKCQLELRQYEPQKPEPKKENQSAKMHLLEARRQRKTEKD